MNSSAWAAAFTDTNMKCSCDDFEPSHLEINMWNTAANITALHKQLWCLTVGSCKLSRLSQDASLNLVIALERDIFIVYPEHRKCGESMDAEIPWLEDDLSGTWVHPKLRNTNLHNVNHSLIFRNPREQGTDLRSSNLTPYSHISLFCITNFVIMQTTKAVNPRPRIASCVNMWSVFLFFFFLCHLLNCWICHIVQEVQADWGSNILVAYILITTPHFPRTLM